jgi:hypothetical protein
VKVFGIVVLILALLIAGIVLTGVGGQHGPRRHIPAGAPGGPAGHTPVAAQAAPAA